MIVITITVEQNLISNQYNHVHNILRLLMVEQIFLSPQVKQSMIVSNKPANTSCLTTYLTTLDLGS